jgi:hypothetical protein
MYVRILTPAVARTMKIIREDFLAGRVSESITIGVRCYFPRPSVSFSLDDSIVLENRDGQPLVAS